MRIFNHALRRTLRDDLGVRRRIRVVDFRQESAEHEVSRLLAAGIAFAQVAADAPNATDLANDGALLGVIAENMDRRGRGDEFDQLARTDGDALSATDAKPLVDFRKSVHDRNRVLRADIRTRPVAETAVGAPLVAARRRRRDAAVTDSVVVADLNGLASRTAALDERNSLFGRRRRHAEDLRDCGGAGFAADRARPVRSRPRDKGVRVAVAPREPATAAVRPRQRRRHESDARVFPHAQIPFRDRQNDRRNKPDSRNDKNCRCHDSHFPLRLL